MNTLSNGSVTNLRIYNTDSSDHTITFTGVGSGVTVFTVPQEGFVDLELVRNDGATRIYQRNLPPQVDSTAATTSEIVDDFNALLAKLRSAGILMT